MHHLNSVAHWSEMPLYFIKNLDEHEAQDAIIFHTLDYTEMSMLVFSNQVAIYMYICIYVLLIYVGMMYLFMNI